MNRFRSRISIILLLICIFASIAPFFLKSGRYVHVPEGEYAWLINLLIAALILWILFGIRYVITETEVYIQMWPLKFGRNKIEDIKTVERSYIPLSSPAASLKRLLIESDNCTLLISPANETKFVRLLKEKNPKIQVTIDDKTDWWRFWDWDV